MTELELTANISAGRRSGETDSNVARPTINYEQEAVVTHPYIFRRLVGLLLVIVIIVGLSAPLLSAEAEKRKSFNWDEIMLNAAKEEGVMVCHVIAYPDVIVALKEFNETHYEARPSGSLQPKFYFDCGRKV